MKFEQEVREALINNAIALIAEGGFERATTRAIAHEGIAVPGVRMNEVYIYRLFGSKEGLYDTAFERLDKQFVFSLLLFLDHEDGFLQDTKRRLYDSFLKIWYYLMLNEPHCRFYVRYYYSTYFRGAARERHNELFDGVLEGFAPLFREEADVASIMHSVLTAMLDFAIRVFNGDLEDHPKNTPHVFNVLYLTMSDYFRAEVAREPGIMTYV